MLKALELLGFKSFPVKTRFDFPPGITVIVGPNGSGKSNIVDAMKWVLGEQSARSLRGKEMADVIYKGSGGGKRKPANTAEATIVFDNRERRLQIEADEVLVTRRVYRSGEGEYLINGQACRLRDVRDLFRGTGVGTDAYSLIEQGKVDSLLQASPKDRRAIFEEAAGISRFKAKKIEAQRRLERVEQNLLRLSDIVEEVHHRLRRLRSQASKARRYKDCIERLQRLRTQVGRVDWQSLTMRLAAVTTELGSLESQVVTSSQELDQVQSEVNALEVRIAECDDRLQVYESRVSQHRARLAASHSTVSSERARMVDLSDERTRSLGQVMAMGNRAGDLQSQLSAAKLALKAAQTEHLEKASRLTTEQQSLEKLLAEAEASKARSEKKRVQFVEHMRLAADLGHQMTAHQSLLDSAQTTLKRTEEVTADLAKELEQLSPSCDELARQEAEKSEALRAVDAQLKAAQERLASDEDRATELQHELRQGSERRAAAAERAAVLEEFESRMEGVGSGVQEVLETIKAKAGAAGPFAGVRGMVADLFQVTDRHLAHMLDVALGDQAQHLVVAGGQLFDHLQHNDLELSGRVGFVRLQSSAPRRFVDGVDLTGQSGVIGRADQFVAASIEYQHLLQWLLRDTWFVETLSDAVQFHRSVSAPLRFVTRRGELLDRDGRLLVGPTQTGIGLISRRAELQELREALQQMDQRVAEQERRWSELHLSFEDRRGELKSLGEQRESFAEELNAVRAQFATERERRMLLQKQHTSLQVERDEARQLSANAESELSVAREKLTQLESLIRTLETALAAERDSLKRLDVVCEQQQRATTDGEVVVAKSEQRLEALNAQLQQLQRDQAERKLALSEAQQQADRCRQRQVETDLRILNASTQIAQDRLAEEHFAAKAVQITRERNAIRQQRSGEFEKARELREHLRAVEQKRHTQELEAEKIRHERGALADRLNEDYGISVTQLEEVPSLEEQTERAEVDQEIHKLRHEISNLGAVNMDALEDLNELEARYDSLSSQHQDLTEAKEKLQRIIQKINTDSRRLFAETLEQIRENFSVLFRKVFGGGQAKVVLEEDVDILEAGIDIVAMPPGKHALGLSLLSGGERALTAVTLLLAIFQYRPSPFCVLDEVDGPLDEANVGRFVDVLKEFLQWTKFVIVTHSKKTMTAANTLYGVTMQESGVSKRVSIRFEDVGSKGEISQDAIRRSASESDDSDDSIASDGVSDDTQQVDGDDERGAA